jgi:phosphoglycerol transferase MdoB-like AlkP superfamily enzyme
MVIREVLSLTRKYKIRVKNYFINVLLVVLFSVILSIIGIMLSDVVDMMNIGRYIKAPLLFVLNLLPLLLLMLLLYHLSARLWVTFGLGGGLYIVMHIINRFMMELREEPFTPSDILLGTEAAAVVKISELPFSPIIIMSLAFWLVMTLILIVFVKPEKLRWPVRIAGAAAAVILFALSYTGIYKNTKLYDSFEVTGSIYSRVSLYKSRGFMYSFMVRTGTYKSVKPDGYDIEAAKQALAGYDQPDHKVIEGDLPNIIAVMGEAFYDIDRIPGIEFNEGYDPLANIDRIRENAYSGRIVTNVFGGGTANTEFAFLTGHSMPIMPELTSPYQYYIRKDTFSLARVLEDKGYATMAFHPGDSWFYNRVNVYKFFGFDNIYFKNDMDLSKVEMNHGYISDKDTYAFTLDKFRQQKEREPGKPFFQFVVDIDNHGPYSKKDLGYPKILKRTEAMDDTVYNTLNNYLNGVMRCDKALGAFVDSIMEMDEPIILLYFADHLPYLGEDDIGYKALNFDVSTDGSLQAYLNNYETPYFITANEAAKKMLSESGISMKKGEAPHISSNYLATELLETAGINGGSYFNYLSALKKELPVITSRFFKEGDEYTEDPSQKTKDMIHNYSVVQYYMLMEREAAEP